MRTEFSPAAQMRSAARSALPEKAFLRRDRGDGLFISNAPVFAPDLDQIPGFDVEYAGRLMRIRPDASWIGRIEAETDPFGDDFALSLRRFARTAPTEEAMALFCRGLKLLDAGESASTAEIEGYDRSVRHLAARALRKETGGGGLYALSLLDAMLKT